MRKQKKYIGKKGFFGDDLRELKDAIDNKKYSILTEIYPKVAENYDDFLFCEDGCTYFRYFLPADKVKEVEEPKKWRAFRTYDELKENGLDLGFNLAYRRKDNREQRNIGKIIGFQLVDNKLTISIGPNTFSLNQLFNEYERYDELEWKPFGVKE